MFKFGRNWKNYVNNVVNEKVIDEAKNSLFKYLPENCYKNSTFIDVGCGSGLFSFASLLLGCKRVISFDIDKESLEALEILIKKFEYLLPSDYSTKWHRFQGSILDDSLIEKYSQSGDIVYAWGVLHHTGKMWEAIKNTCRLVKPGGYLILGIYNWASVSKTWEKIKKFYNKNPILQPLLGISYGIFVTLGYIIKRKTLNLYRERGMHVFYDAIDWIGGWPYEYACFEEIKNFVENLGFQLIKAPTKLPCGKNKKYTLWDVLRTKDVGNNEFVFKSLRL